MLLSGPCRVLIQGLVTASAEFVPLLITCFQVDGWRIFSWTIMSADMLEVLRVVFPIASALLRAFFRV
jgi:hypothetical protein